MKNITDKSRKNQNTSNKNGEKIKSDKNNSEK